MNKMNNPPPPAPFPNSQSSQHNENQNQVNQNNIPGNMQVNMSGNIQGNLPGNMQGNMPGNMQGNMPGNMQGNIPGNMQGNMQGNMPGNMQGNMQGNMPGNMQGNMPGDMQGNMPGNMQGNMPGNMQGNMPGNMQGNMPGNMQGNMPGYQYQNSNYKLNPPMNNLSDIIANPWAKNKSNNKEEVQNSEKLINQNEVKNDYDDDFEPQPKENENNDDPSICQMCKSNPNILYLECVHPICHDCFEKMAKENLFEMKCKICNKDISEQLKKDVLQDKYANLEKIALMKVLGADLIKCPYPNCGEQIAFEPGQIDYNVKDDNGKVLTRQAAENYAKNRCRCGFCRKDFCKECFIMPYHLGKTCEENRHHQEAKKCRYCDSEIKGFNMGPDDDVCNQGECRQRYTISCKKRIGCGHKCYGVNGEKACPPCLDRECKQFGGQFDQDKDAYCPICYTEGLGSSPIVVTSCGHYMHYQCIKKRLETKWIGPKITFNHCLCPSCNKWFDIQTIPELQKMIDENKKLYESIKEMALKRLKFEDLDKDPRLTDPNSPWFGKKVEFAMKRLSYYMCYVCKKPYFAGRRECGNDPNMNNDDPNKNYDPKDCVCGKDANLSGVAGKTNCPKHGKDFIEYKCKFCCKIASWFCWGTTHFCEDCHKRQCNGDYVSKYSRDRLPRCNRATCEVGGNHPPNGEEFALGCSICRNNAENDKGF
jgi:E3 ubiquitin-protein ligase MYCBP2